MDLSFKKIAAKLGKILVGLVLLVFVLLAIALNFVFTPEKITPKVVKAINQNLKAEMKVESIELSFFKTFPSFTLEIVEGSIVNHLQDSILSQAALRRDTVLTFDRCQVTVNPWSFLRNKIVVNHLILERPEIYAYISESGSVNWDILKERDSIEIEPETPDSTSEFKASIDIQDLKIDRGKLFFENEITEMHAGLSDLDVNLKATYENQNILLDLGAESPSISLFKNKDTVLDHVGLGIQSKLEMEGQKKVLHMDHTRFKLNDAAFVLSGDVSILHDPTALGLDLLFGLQNASMENLLGLIPASVINKKAIPETKGDIALEGKIKGNYGKDIYPVIDANLQIKNGEIAYQGMPNKLDRLEADLTVLIDPDDENNSFLELQNCQLSGKNTDIQINFKASDLFHLVKINANLDGKIDLGELQKTMPLREGIELSGLFDSKVWLSFSKEDLLQANYGNIQGKGYFRLENFKAENQLNNRLLKTKLTKVEFIQKDDSKILSDAGTKVRGGRIDINDLMLHDQSRFELQAQKMLFEYGAIPKKDSLSISRIKSKIELTEAKFSMGDTLKGRITRAIGDLAVDPSTLNPMKPSIQTMMQIDSAGIRSKNNYFGIKRGSYKVSTEKNEANLWPLDGEISFESMILFAASFPLDLKMPETKVKLREGVVILEKAHLNVGRSDFTATGKLYNFGGRFFRDELMKGDLSIRSQFTDVNQIIKTLNAGEKNEKAEEIDPNAKLVTIADVETADSTSVFVVPKGVEFVWNTHIDKVELGKLTLKNLKGQVTLKDQKLAMNSLNMITNGAKMFTSSTYEAKTKQQAHLVMDFKLLDIDLANLIDMFPVLDSIMPMANSFEGNVNFRMKGRADMDANLGMSPNKLELIARILGKDMVVMDSETFRKLAKMLFFKDKKRNVIDEMSFALQYKDQALEVFPSEFEVDRYRIAVGGVQRLNGNYSFHMSVLKTPVPLVKMGIDVKGTAQGNDFDLTNAKYKYFFAKRDKRRAKADQDLMARKESVIQRLPF